jgi:SAM-dependent methyltransferase
MSAREGLAIEWHEGRAEALPLPDESFDLVLCQQALQFFADPEAALTEMYRVLAEDGKVAVSTWQSIEHHPFYQMLDDVIQHHLGMSGVGDIFKLGDAEELRALLMTAGFCDVEIAQVSITARFPDPENFLAGEIDVDTAAIPAWQHLSTRERQDLAATIRTDMEEPLRQVTEGNEVVLPFHAHIATAGH